MATVPTPWRMGTNGILPSSAFNGGVFDVLTLLMNPPMCELFQIATQSTPNGGAILTFDGEVIDTEGMHSLVSNTSRITAQTPGRYLVWGATSWNANTAGTRGGWLNLNGVTVNGTEFMVAAGNPNQTVVPMRVKLVYMNPGDYLEMFGWQASGGALSTLASGQSGSTFGVRWVGTS